MATDLLAHVTAASLRKESLGDFEVGDSVNVHRRIKEGDKERVQLFGGTVISICRGQGKVNATFTVRRVVAGEGVELTFPSHSPRVVKVDVVRRGRVRRAKLFYLRDRVGKATKVEELMDAEAADGADAKPAAKPASAKPAKTAAPKA